MEQVKTGKKRDHRLCTALRHYIHVYVQNIMRTYAASQPMITSYMFLNIR